MIDDFGCTLKKVKTASILNFVGVALYFLVVISFFVCAFGDGWSVDSSGDPNNNFGVAITFVIFLVVALIGFGLLLLFVIYKIVFACILHKNYLKAISGQQTNLKQGLFIASIVLKILSIIVIISMSMMISFMFFLVNALLLSLLLGLLLWALAVLEIVTLVAENKARKEEVWYMKKRQEEILSV